MTTGQAKAQSEPPLGVYVHVPFCARTCDFCAFYQEAPKRPALEAYLRAMEQEFSLHPPDRPVETVFWGGGTPGLLPAKDLHRLGKAMLASFPGPLPPREWTIEMAPSTVKADKLAVLGELGVTRISMGVQSFREAMLESLGRLHSVEQVDRAIDLVREAGFENLNLDMIFSFPGQTLEAWETDLKAAIARSPAHISTYCLTFEEDTALWVRMRRGEVRIPTEEEDARLYELTWERLAEAGYAQYEVSNFAREGYRCLHNLNTWDMAAWIGYGPGAASQYRGMRWMNVADLEIWKKGLSQWAKGEGNGASIQVERVELTPRMMLGDCLVFGLRRNCGVNLAEMSQRFPSEPLDNLAALWQSLCEAKYLDEHLYGQGKLVLTPHGRLLADQVGVQVLEALEGERVLSITPRLKSLPDPEQ